MKVKPLTKRTMTLNELQKRTTKVLKACIEHLRVPTHLSGVTDEEFIDAMIGPLVSDIWTDRQMLKMLAKPTEPDAQQGEVGT